MQQFFELTAAKMPAMAKTWFTGFNEGAQIPFDSKQDADTYIENLCERAGTITDPNYRDFGPVAVRV